MPVSNQIELRHLRYFLAVAEELHFRKASEKLFITQPALSRQIQQLESYVGTQLFERSKRNVRLTAAGAYWYDEVRFLLNHLDASIKSMQSLARGDEGEIRIGFVGSAMQNVIPQTFIKMNARYPKLHTTLEEMPNMDQVNALKHDRLDVGFVRLNRVEPDLDKRMIFEDTFSLVLPTDHWMDEAGFLDVGQLSDEKFILFSSDYSSGYYDTIMSICEDQGFSPEVSHRSVHANTIFRLVENHMGVSIIPTSLSQGFDLKVKFIELKKIPQRTHLSVIWKKGNRNPALQKFLDLVKEIKHRGTENTEI